MRYGFRRTIVATIGGRQAARRAVRLQARSRCVIWKLAARRSARGIGTDQDGRDAVGNRRGKCRLDQETNKRKMVDSRPGPVRSLKDAAAAVVIAAAVERAERSSGRGGQCGVLRSRTVRDRTLQSFLVTVHCRPGGGSVRDWPAHAVHALRRSDARKRQRPERRHEHDQQQKAGRPTRCRGYVPHGRVPGSHRARTDN